MTDIKKSLPQYQLAKDLLRGSLRRMENLSFNFLLIPTLLLGVVYLTIWSELNYPSLSSWNNLFRFFATVDFSYVLTMLLVVSQILEFVMIRSLVTEYFEYCRIHLYMIPFVWTLILLNFTMVIWGCLASSGNNNSAVKLVIIVGSAVILISNFLNYYMKTLSKHLHLLALVQFAKNPISDANV